MRVIGAGTAGRAHRNGYRQATSLYGSGPPEVRLVAVAVADVHEPSEFTIADSTATTPLTVSS